MGTVEDIPNVLQDFLTPELRELKARIENLERNMTEGFSRVDRQFEQLTRHVDQRITSLEAQLSLSERVARLEQSQETNKKQ